MAEAETPFSLDELDTFSAVYERDVDIALVGAIRASAAIRAWILKSVDLPASELLNVRHSLPTNDQRESDIELRFGTPTASYVIQLENKLDATFQPGQQASYASRAESMAEASDVAGARCALFCPRAYALTADCRAFDAVLSYEHACDILINEGAWGRTTALLIQHAIVKHRRGGSETPNDPMRTEFFKRFSELAHQVGLPLAPHRQRKRNAGFLWWPRAGTLRQPKGWNPRGSHGAWLSAKFIHGSADIELTGVGAACDISELAAQLERQGIDFESNDAHLRIRKAAPRLEPSRDLHEQRDAADAFVRSIAHQHTWWHEVGRRIVEEQILKSHS